MKTTEKQIRINSGIRPDQSRDVKIIAKKEEKGEGEVIRMMIDYYIKNNPIK